MGRKPLLLWWRMEFKNITMTDEPYKAFLYKKIDGEVKSKIFRGEEATQAGLDDGWKKSPAAFVDEAPGIEDVPDEDKEKLKDIADMLARDADILANADKVESISVLKEAYAQLAGKPMNKMVTTLPGARNACKKLLGNLDGNSTDVR